MQIQCILNSSLCCYVVYVVMAHFIPLLSPMQNNFGDCCLRLANRLDIGQLCPEGVMEGSQGRSPRILDNAGNEEQEDVYHIPAEAEDGNYDGDDTDDVHAGRDGCQPV